MAQPTSKAGTTTLDAPNQTVELTDRTARRQNAPSTQYDSDQTSSSGSSSEEDSESEGEDEQHTDRQANGSEASATQTKSDSLPHISAHSKPHIRSIKGDSEILSRLNAFLPQIKSANEDLQKQIDDGTAEDLVLDNAEANGERYIEMVCWLCQSHLDCGLLMRTPFRISVLGSWRRSARVIPLATRVMSKTPKIQRMILILLGSLWAGRGSRRPTNRLSKRWRNEALFDLTAFAFDLTYARYVYTYPSGRHGILETGSLSLG